MPIPLLGRVSEQVLEVPISGPPGQANRLFIFSGIAILVFKGTGSAWNRDYIEFEIGRVFSPGQVKEIVAMAYLNSIKNEGQAVNSGWAVDAVRAWWDSIEYRIKLHADLAVRDIDGYIQRMGWTVHVLARI